MLVLQQQFGYAGERWRTCGSFCIIFQHQISPSIKSAHARGRWPPLLPALAFCCRSVPAGGRWQRSWAPGPRPRNAARSCSATRRCCWWVLLCIMQQRALQCCECVCVCARAPTHMCVHVCVLCTSACICLGRAMPSGVRGHCPVVHAGAWRGCDKLMFHVQHARDWCSTGMWLRILIFNWHVAASSHVVQACGQERWCSAGTQLRMLMFNWHVAASSHVVQACGQERWCSAGTQLRMLMFNWHVAVIYKVR